MVFARDAVEGDWKWGENSLPKVCKYTYLGIDFQCNGEGCTYKKGSREW